MDKAPNRQRRRLALLLWVLVAVVYFSISINYIQVSMRDKEFGEYIRHVAQISGEDRRLNKDIRAMIMAKATQLELPVLGEQIAIAGSGDGLNIAVDYQVDIEIPVFDRGIYTKHFSHNVKYVKPH
jgi:hypothetical protein